MIPSVLYKSQMVQHSTLKVKTVLFKNKIHLIKTGYNSFLYMLYICLSSPMIARTCFHLCICVFLFVVITNIHLIHSIGKNLVQFSCSAVLAFKIAYCSLFAFEFWFPSSFCRLRHNLLVQNTYTGWTRDWIEMEKSTLKQSIQMKLNFYLLEIMFFFIALGAPWYVEHWTHFITYYYLFGYAKSEECRVEIQIGLGNRQSRSVFAN